jgi:hypothetical protein
MVFGYRMVRRVFESKCETVTGKCKKSRNYKLYIFFNIHQIILGICSMHDISDAYNILIGESEGENWNG